MVIIIPAERQLDRIVVESMLAFSSVVQPPGAASMAVGP